MQTVSEIVIKIRSVVTKDDGKKVKNSDIARLLGMTPDTLGQRIHSNRMPFKEVLDFCVDHNILINTFLYTDRIGKTYSVEYRGSAA